MALRCAINYTDCEGCSYHSGVTCDPLKLTLDAADLIEEQAAEIERLSAKLDEAMRRPVGRWLNPSECGGNAFGACSLCGAWYDVMQAVPDEDFRYCPHCGAKIDGGNDND